MRVLELIGNQLVLPRIALEIDAEAARMVAEYPGMFDYDCLRQVYVLKPWAVLAGLRGMGRFSNEAS